MIREEDVYKIGKLGKPHGVKGEVSMHFADDIFDRTDCDYLILRIDGIMVPFFMEEYRFRSEETALVKFCDIDTQERAAELTGCEVYFPRDVAATGEGAPSYAAITGFEIIDSVTGRNAGRIASVDDTTVNTLFEMEDGRLIPAAAELIEDVDTSARKIVMRLPEGILSEE
ncbi:MAG: 16S rRNA processing protein RimM [Prevotella sp.]|nr:16S rRNA processing protein RimM [Prevotella sp.]